MHRLTFIFGRIAKIWPRGRVRAVIYFLFAVVTSYLGMWSLMTNEWSRPTPLDLASEFHKQAPLAWDKMRSHLMSRNAKFAIEISTKFRLNHDEPPRSDVTHVVHFHNGRLACVEAIPAEPLLPPLAGQQPSKSWVTGMNEQYMFRISRERSPQWIVHEVVQHRGGMPRWEGEDDIRLVTMSDIELPVGFKSILAADPRLWGQGFQIPVERFFKEKKSWISGFAERMEPAVGRVITVKLEHESEDRSGRKMLLSGFVELLPNHYWSVYSQEMLVFDQSNTQSNPISVHKVNVSYSSSDLELPLVVTEETKNEMTGFETSRTLSFRLLSPTEIQAIKAKCYLSEFGLAEPEFFKRSWPISSWLWLTLGLTLLVGGMVSVRRYQSRNNQKTHLRN